MAAAQSTMASAHLYASKRLGTAGQMSDCGHAQADCATVEGKEMQMLDRESLAREYFQAGHNCPQSVVLSFSDVLAERRLDAQITSRLASPFGGGMGRMREVCGAVSGMLMVLGLVEGYEDPTDDISKAELYEHVQTLIGRFKDEQGSYLCRELLGLDDGPDTPKPQKRTEAYYQARPCAELCACAARILAEHLSS